MQITRGKRQKAERVVIYGPEGIGKTTFASHFPDPLFIDTEGSTSDLDVARLPDPSSWAMIVQAVNYVRQNPDCCKSLVIDTADWAEKLCKEMICAKFEKSGIEDFGYGKGYVYLAEEFGKFLNALTDIAEGGIHVILAAHAQIRKFEQPDETGAYDRWELKLEKKTTPLLKEWSTMLLFANYKTLVVKDENDKARARGGQRVMYTSHHACWDAKNRKGMPEELPFSYESIRKYIPEDLKAKPQASDLPETRREEPPKIEAASKAAEPRNELPEEIPEDAPNAFSQSAHAKLQDLMDEAVIRPGDLMAAVEKKGYYPAGTPIENYDPSFVEGALIAAWDQVKKMINEMKIEEMPF